MAIARDDRVTVLPLGVMGTVTRVREDGRYAVLADCADQPVTWRRSEIEPACECDQGGSVPHPQHRQEP